MQTVLGILFVMAVAKFPDHAIDLPPPKKKEHKRNNNSQ